MVHIPLSFPADICDSHKGWLLLSSQTSSSSLSLFLWLSRFKKGPEVDARSGGHVQLCGVPLPLYSRLEHKRFQGSPNFSKPVSRNETPRLNIVLVPSRSSSTMSTRRHAAVLLPRYHVDEHARLAAAVWQRCSSWQGSGQRRGRVTARRVHTLTHTNSLLKAQRAGVCVRARVC